MGNCQGNCATLDPLRSPPPQVRDPSLFRLKLGSVVQFRDLTLLTPEPALPPWASVHRGYYYGVPVLVKQLSRPSSAVVQCFNCAVRLLVTLDHPNVLEFVGASLDAGPAIYMVTERLERGDLASLLASATPLSVTTRLSMMLDIARGLHYLHAQKPPIVHRNVTARNVHIS
ncbi:hypothetical protein SPRG_20261 [Saprolegnia parasitica CBS 223.65]|uniref:Protein kinase domain-containing protein n=1 Tax=Saprolegnia parasitica (strain CBS 223.65) TaxID=695850 RepID=A0A067CC84_SAPPC|nr:hypothetical protein SPRG_20261 [Saprolegnia parasitica CBS 223.65]KDO28103.1 hypothetical protein SPRG_20261 [Saprolegnia parasitica CBS 223.65]|eukprot:XP_012201244.1 hypothetical protein SPRG_20261 [Saprolegnia parasitica CBS 223.65]